MSILQNEFRKIALAKFARQTAEKLNTSVPRNTGYFACNPSKPPVDRGDVKASPLSRGD